MTTGSSGVLDWDGIRRKAAPSFSLPSSHGAIRAFISDSSFREVCSNLPQEQFTHNCYREAVAVPLLLNHPEGHLHDGLQLRPHTEYSRRSLRPNDSLNVHPMTTSDMDALSKGLGRLEVTDKVGAVSSSNQATRGPEDILPSLQATLSSLGVRPSTSTVQPFGSAPLSRPQSVRHQRTPVWPQHQEETLPGFRSARETSFSSGVEEPKQLSATQVVEAAVASAAAADKQQGGRCDSAGGHSWASTPIPQPGASTALRFTPATLSESGTADVLEHALSLKPARPQRRLHFAASAGREAWRSPRAPISARDATRKQEPPKAGWSSTKTSQGASTSGRGRSQPLAPLPEMRRLGGPMMSKLRGKV